MAVSPVYLEFGGKGRLWTIPERGEHLGGLAVIVIDRLLAQQHQAGLLPLDQREHGPGEAEWLQVGRGFDLDGAVCAHGQAGTKLLLAIAAAQ